MARWHYGHGATFCRNCKEAQSIAKSNLDCSECDSKPPSLLPENEEYFRLFQVCSSQLRVSMGGVYALDWTVVYKTAEALKVDITESFIYNLRLFESVMIEEINKKTDGKSK